MTTTAPHELKYGVWRVGMSRGRSLRYDDARELYGVALSPYATARHLAQLWDMDGKRTTQVVYKSLARLKRAGYVQAVDYRDQHHNPGTTFKLNHITPQGVRALETTYRMDRDDLYHGKGQPPVPMLSSEWQHHLSRHLDIVVRTYDYVCAIKRVTGNRSYFYFPRQGSLDAWVWQDWQEGLSIGFLRAGPALETHRLTARIRALAHGTDDLTSRHRDSGGRRGPGFVLISVPTELDKHLVSGWFAPGGKFASLHLQGLVSTEADASRGIWYNPRTNGWLTWKDIAEFQPATGTYDPVPPAYKGKSRIRNPRTLPAPLHPVQSRVIDTLYRYPLMRPTEIAATVGVSYNGRFNDNLAGMVDLGLVKDIRELAAAQLVTYDISERRNRPLLLTDKGYLYLAGRDRAKSGRYNRDDQTEQKEADKKRDRKQRGILDRWGTEGVTKDTERRFLGGDIGKMTREMEHTLQVNASVARICRDLPYVPETLPDHCNRRYYKTSNWMGEYGDERLVMSSVAPDAAIVLRDGDRRRTVMLEIERSAAEGGGTALTRKASVWFEYAKQGGHKYMWHGHHELVAFIVPNEAALEKLVKRIRLLRRRYMRHIEIVVTTKYAFEHADNVLTDRIWTLATHPELPDVFLDLPAVPVDAKS